MYKLIVCLAATILSAACFGKTFKATPDRLVRVSGVIDEGFSDKTNQLITLSTESTKPVDIVINSPGGSIASMLQFVNAMRAAQSRGVKIRCMTPMYAASAAFIIFAQCDERYALSYSLLLWHPGKSMSMAPLSRRDLYSMAAELEILERPIIGMLIRTLRITPEQFYLHYYRETLWTAIALKKLAPGFLTIVDDVSGVVDWGK